MTHLFGFLLAIGLLKAASLILKLESDFYMDEVAAIMVIGGTLCAAIITYPISDLGKMLMAFVRIAKKNPENREFTVRQLVELSQAAQASRSALTDASQTPGLNPFLKDGIDLILSGFSKTDLEDIMAERLYRDREREEVYGNILRTLSKYPPAFGLVGTVLGLVSVMKSVSAGASAAEIGINMALALVATFYGLIFANFVLVPMSENLFNKSSINMTHRELMLEGLLMIHERTSPLVIQEKLNSYLPPLKRKDYVGLNSKNEEIAA
jgi:chemotaxis protein MotA